MPKKIALCFLVYDRIKHENNWNKFLEGYEDYWTLYSHIKTPNSRTSDLLRKNKVKTVETEWCGEGLVWAFVNMLKEALKNKHNEFFQLLSGDCIPLRDFEYTYKNIMRSKKSRIEIEKKTKNRFIASQWVLLNRKTARILVELYTKKNKKIIDDIWDSQDFINCPDEFFPINWLIYRLGRPSSVKFKQQVNSKVVTYTYWGNRENSPYIINMELYRKLGNEIYKSGALFSRKYTKGVAKLIQKNY